jgi:hypothetical protein
MRRDRSAGSAIAEATVERHSGGADPDRGDRRIVVGPFPDPRDHPVTGEDEQT